MHKINSHTEWGTLKEVILGIADYSQVPTVKKHDIHCVDYANYDTVNGLPGGKYSTQILEETAEDLNVFQQQLENIGVVVHRPTPTDHSVKFSNSLWETDGYYLYCPRDSALVIGDTIIETPMPLRSRYFETFGYKHIFQEYFMAGSKWLSAPKPQLKNELYDRSDLSKPTLRNTEIAFDAANVIKCGKDIFFLISNSGNELGARWLQTTLGETYRIHKLHDVYAYIHLDTTILPLAPGKVLLNPDRINDNNIPEYFKSWDKIWCTEPIITPYEQDWAVASPWIGMNVLSLSDKLVAVEKRQTTIIRQLESYGFDVMEVSLRHCRTMSGGPHCVTLDTVRDDYFEDFS